MRLLPDSWGSKLKEHNPCHNPPGEGGGQFCSKPGSITGSPAFKQWFGKSKVVDADGNPLRVYHGTTMVFDEFDPDRANPESDFGKGIYFSDTIDDVNANYAGVGPDLKQKITMRAEQLASERDLPYDDPQALADARAEFMQHGGTVLAAYLKMENPAIVGGRGETVLTIQLPEEDEDGNFIGEETGTLIDFIQAVRQISSRYDDGDPEPAIQSLLDGGSEDVPLSRVLDVFRKDEHFGYFTNNDDGKLMSHEILRQALERIGFDGVIDRTVDSKFGSGSRYNPMRGMTRQTTHYIAFRPEQVKSAIGNRRFSFSRKFGEATRG
jgi:hypothetical protein